MPEHPYPAGLRVRNFGQQYPEARQGTATLLKVVRGPFTVQGDEGLYEYLVRADTRLPGMYREVEWSSEATVPGEFPDDFAHDIDALGGGQARCPCGWTGNDADEAADHARAYGMCGECWGSGTDAYPCLGICHYCGGDLTADAEAAGRAALDAAEAEITAAEEAQQLDAIRAEEQMVLDGEREV